MLTWEMLKLDMPPTGRNPKSLFAHVSKPNSETNRSVFRGCNHNFTIRVTFFTTRLVVAKTG